MWVKANTIEQVTKRISRATIDTVETFDIDEEEEIMDRLNEKR